MPTKPVAAMKFAPWLGARKGGLPGRLSPSGKRSVLVEDAVRLLTESDFLLLRATAYDSAQ